MKVRQESPTLFCPVGEARHHAALQQTCEHASRAACLVELLAVVEEPSAWDRLAHSDHAETVERDRQRTWTNTVARWANEFDEVTKAEVRIGATARTIVEYAQEIGAGTIVLSMAHGRQELDVAKRVMRLTTTPVWVIRPTRAEERRILVAVNPEVDELDLNLKIMSCASRLADALDADLVLMTAWELYGEQTTRRAAFLKAPVPQFHDLFDLREGISRRGLKELVTASPNPDAWTLHLENGPPAPSILRAIRQHRSNLVVMGTVGRSGLSGLLMGNTAEYVLDGARCSVYAVRGESASR